MNMYQFTTNLFLSRSLNFIILLIVLISFFHLIFVWPKNLSKKSWKIIDYIWLSTAALGMISLAADVRVSTAKNWLKMEKVRTSAILESIVTIENDPKSSYYCTQFIKTPTSPDDLDVKQKQYDLACKWIKELSKYFKTIQKEELPVIHFEELPKVTFDEPILNETVIWLKERLSDYQDQLELFKKTQETAQKGKWEKTLSYFAPFLICIAIALRITKVTGELRHET